MHAPEPPIDHEWRSLLEALHQPVLVVDADGHVVLASVGATDLFGLDPAALAGGILDPALRSRVLRPDGRPTRPERSPVRAMVLAMRAGATVPAGTPTRYRYQHPDGHERWIEQAMRPLHLAGAPHVAVVLRDVTDEERLAEVQRQLAAADPLTGLPTAEQLRPRLAEHVEQPDVDIAVLAVELIGLDVSPEEAPTHDAVVRVMGERLVAAVRAHDTVARVDDHRFVVVCVVPVGVGHGAPPVETKTADIADRIVARIAEPVDLPDGRQAVVTSAVGVVTSLDLLPPTADTLLACAEQAQAVARDAGPPGWARWRHESSDADAVTFSEEELMQALFEPRPRVL